MLRNSSPTSRPTPTSVTNGAMDPRVALALKHIRTEVAMNHKMQMKTLETVAKNVEALKETMDVFVATPEKQAKKILAEKTTVNSLFGS